jgi:hypothetical protein
VANGKHFQGIIGGIMNMVPTTFADKLDMNVEVLNIQQTSLVLPLDKLEDGSSVKVERGQFLIVL